MIIIILSVIIIIGSAGFRPDYRGAWPVRLLCPAYTLIGPGNMMMMLLMMMMTKMMMVMMLMIMMLMMMMTNY